MSTITHTCDNMNTNLSAGFVFNVTSVSQIMCMVVENMHAG